MPSVGKEAEGMTPPGVAKKPLWLGVARSPAKNLLPVALSSQLLEVLSATQAPSWLAMPALAPAYNDTLDGTP